MSSAEPVHTESETHPWSVNVPNHPQRVDSPQYVAARKQMIGLAAQAPGLIYGPAPYQDHHGSALWMKDAQGWFLVRNFAGIEWSAQFCADPAKVGLLRQNAKRLYDLLAPEIKQQLDPGGLLDTPIQDAAGVASWTDSIFNADGIAPSPSPSPSTGQEPGGVHQLAQQKQAVESVNAPLILGPDHPLSQQAFIHQQATGATTADPPGQP